MNKCCKEKLADLAHWELRVTNLEDDLDKIVNMYWIEEHRDWEELENPNDHIFHAFNNIKNYLIGRHNDNSKSSKVE